MKKARFIVPGLFSRPLMISVSILWMQCPTQAVEPDDLKVSLSQYYDNREFLTSSLGVSLNGLPAGFSIWGFTDFHWDSDNESRPDNSFSEYRLYNNLVGKALHIDGLSLLGELNYFTPQDLGVGRLGVSYKHDLPRLSLFSEKKGWLAWRYYPLETRKHRSQGSWSYYIPLHDKVKITGFADYSINSRGKNRWVIEPQLNIQIVENFWFLMEYRFNGFEDANPAIDGEGLAFGFKYEFKF